MISCFMILPLINKLMFLSSMQIFVSQEHNDYTDGVGLEWKQRTQRPRSSSGLSECKTGSGGWGVRAARGAPPPPWWGCWSTRGSPPLRTRGSSSSPTGTSTTKYNFSTLYNVVQCSSTEEINFAWSCWVWQSSIRIFKQSIGARNRAGIGLSYTGSPGYIGWRK